MSVCLKNGQICGQLPSTWSQAGHNLVTKSPGMQFLHENVILEGVPR